MSSSATRKMGQSTKRMKPSTWSTYIHSIASSLQEEQQADDDDDTARNNSALDLTSQKWENDGSAALWSLPDAILFGILSFIAAPTHRASVVCHQLAPLNHACYNQFYKNELLWEAILQEDYGVARDGSRSNLSSRSSSDNKRRRCSRLDRSPLERVKEAHRLAKDNTEIAFYYLSEHVNASTKKDGLSHRLLVYLLQEYGPHLRVNQRTSNGGLFLVEVCRSKNVKEQVVLKCVQELVEQHGALVDSQTYEAASAYQTALSVASVRGMPSVVKYLLERGASPEIRSSGRFRLNKNPKKTMRYVNLNCLEFAIEAKKAELEHGATTRDLKEVNECVATLEAAMKTSNTNSA